MTGNIGLIVRIALYVAAGWLAQMGLGSFDADAGTFTVDLDALAGLIGGCVSLGIGLVWRRAAKKRGGVT